VEKFDAFDNLEQSYPKSVTFESLKMLVSKMSVMAKVETRTPKLALVRVFNNTGTSMYLAKAAHELAWLATVSSKKEDKGTCTMYYVPVMNREQ